MMFGRESMFGSLAFIDVLGKDALEMQLFSSEDAVRAVGLAAELIMEVESDEIFSTEFTFKISKNFGVSVPGRPGGENER